MLSTHLVLAESPPRNPTSPEELRRHDHYTITPIDHDYPGKTPAMWNASYEKFGINAVMAMVVGSPASVGAILQSFRDDSKYVGGGSGSGFKELVLSELDGTTPLAKAIGAVNIIKKDVRGRLIGDNTDGEGYARSLESALAAEGRSLRGAHVLMLGAGGSGRAIAFALANKGARLDILNRTESKARELADSLNKYFSADVAFGGGRERLPSLIGTVDAVVSVIDDAKSPLDAYSTIGEMALPVTPESIGRNRVTAEQLLKEVDRSVIISDIRIRKEPTAMLVQAKELGFQTLDGIPMVVNQGVAAFWWLYGDQLAPRGITQADVEEVMRTAAES